jgi:hypothetical protein
MLPAMAVTPKLLAEIGRMLHGDEFVAALARDLKINPRNMGRMLAGERPIPAGVGVELLALIDSKRDQIARQIAE